MSSNIFAADIFAYKTAEVPGGAVLQHGGSLPS